MFQCVIASGGDCVQLVINHKINAKILNRMMKTEPVRIEMKNFKREGRTLITNNNSNIKFNPKV